MWRRSASWSKTRRAAPSAPGRVARRSSRTTRTAAGRRAKLQRGIATVCEVFLAAGARRVFPFLPGMPELSSKRDIAKLRALSLSPSDIEVTAYHPLGTCRMGTDPRTSVVGPDYETHEVKSLYVADGSAVPSALGVNPQLTIMAMALRAAETIDERLA